MAHGAPQPQPKFVSVKDAASRALRDDIKRRHREGEKGKPILGLPTRDSFQSFAFKMGLGTDSPLSKSTFGFNPITRDRTLLEWAHRGSWVAGAAVDIIADDMTRAGVDQKGDIDPSDSEAIEEAHVQMGIWPAIRDTIAWARLYGGAIAYIMIDGQDPKTPLRIETVSQKSFKGLLVLDRWMAEPSMENLVTDLGPYIGLPKFYRITAAAPALPQTTIHYTRCIRLEGVRLPYQQRISENMWGISILERIYDRLLSFEWAATGAGQLVSKAYLRTMSVEGLREIIGTGGKMLEALVTMMQMRARYQGMEGVDMIDAKDTFATQTYSFAGIPEILNSLGEQVAGAIQMPMVRLLGQEPGGLGNDGQSSLRTYYDGINQKQNRELLVGLTNVYRIQAQSLKIKLPEGYGIQFRPLWQLSDKEKSEIAKEVTDTVSAAEGTGLVSKQTALKELKQSSAITGIWSNITDEDIEAADDVPQVPPVAGLLPNGEPDPAADTGAGSNGDDSPPEKKEPKEAKAQDSAVLFKTSAGPRLVNMDYDVPLLGSSSEDGKTVFVDRNWNPIVSDGPLKGLNRLPYLIEHEAVEKKAEDDGEGYATAHYDHAEPAEHAALLRDLKVEPGTLDAKRIIKAYEASYDADLKAAGAKTDPQLPPKMEPKPYEHPHQVRQRKLLAEVKAKDSMASVANMMRFHGLHIVIENPKGSIRKGGVGDKAWEAVLAADYGYIRKNLGADGDEMDCFVGDDPTSEAVYIVDQRDAETGMFDEAKCMVGFSDRTSALAAYRDSYSDKVDRVGAFSETGMDQFKLWLANADLKKPFSGHFKYGRAA